MEHIICIVFLVSNKQPSGLCNMSRIDDKFLQLRTEYIKNDLEIGTKILLIYIV